MRVAVIGAGVAGLVAGHRLTQRGHACDVLERWPGLGGQAATLDVGDGYRLERYYHHLFTSDQEIAALYRELGMADEVEWLESSMAFFVDGRSRPFTSPLDLLRFTPVPLVTRLRMGLAVVMLQRGSKDVADWEAETAVTWIRRRMGHAAYDKVWGPLLRGKFGDRAEDISMAWLWSKLTVRRQIKGEEARTELLGYPRNSWELLYDALRERIEGGGGRVLIDRPATRIDVDDAGGFLVTHGAKDSFRQGLDPRIFSPLGVPEHYDAVISTVPSDVFLELLSPRLTGAMGDEYLARVAAAEYQAAVCLVLELNQRFTPFYWTNVADGDLPFLALIEHTNLVDPGRYGGRRFLYVSNYVAAGDPLLATAMDDLIAQYEPGLRKVNPEFSSDWIRNAWLFREAAAQPVVTLGFRERMPALQTPVPGLILANTQQIYPEDRGTNYSVRLGDHAVALLLYDA